MSVGLRDVVKVEALWQLEVQLDSGALVRPLEGVHDNDIDLHSQVINV